MNRKISTILLSLFCVAMLTACGSKKKDRCPTMDSGITNSAIETVTNYFR